MFDPHSENVALSKNGFADNVVSQIANFDDFDFSEFAKVFEVISLIVAAGSEAPSSPADA